MARRQEEEEDEGFGEASRYTAHLDRGWSLLDRGDFQQARNSAHQAMKIRPEVPDAAMLMAAICLAESDPESSLEWYERAIEADSEYVDAQLAAAQILLYDLDEPQRALARAEIARELDEATLADQLDLGVLEVEALVGMGDYPGARERLGNLAELAVLEQMLSPDTPREDLRHSLEQFIGEPFDLEDDWDHVVQRSVQLAIRVARLYMDLGAAEAAVPWLERLLRTFGDDPDIWYLANEAAYIAGDVVKSAQAALQVLQLDAAAPTPEWSPSASEVHAKVVDLLLKCVDPQLRQLPREPGFAVLVNEAPPFELVLEGVDPRVRSLALAARSARDLDSAPTLTGLALYRRNIVRLARDQGGLERELELAVFDELALFYGLDDVRRERLGLAPTDWNALPPDARPLRREYEHEETRRKPGKPRGDATRDLASELPITIEAAVNDEPAEPAAPPVDAKPAKKSSKRKKKAATSKAKASSKKVARKPAKLLEGKAKTKAEHKPARKRDEPLDD